MTFIDITKEAFNTKQVCKITGISSRQVGHWDQEGLVKPSVRSASGKGSQRLYSYMDMFAFQSVKALRKQGISLQKIRKCVQYLRKHLDLSQPLSYCTLVSDGDSIQLIVEEQTLIDTIKQPGQLSLTQLSISEIDRELRKKVIGLDCKTVEEISVGEFVYQVEIEPDHEDGGFVAEVAGLKGCITQADTREETLDMAKDAIVAYLEAVDELKQRGIELPVKERKRLRKKHA